MAGHELRLGIEFQELGQGSRTSPAYHGQATLSGWPLSETRVLSSAANRNCGSHVVDTSAAVSSETNGRQNGADHTSNLGHRSLVVYNIHLESRNAIFALLISSSYWMMLLSTVSTSSFSWRVTLTLVSETSRRNSKFRVRTFRILSLTSEYRRFHPSVMVDKPLIGCDSRGK